MKLKQPDIKGFSNTKRKKEVSKPTPMMAQYLEVKKRHEEYLLFYRMGDFYELFFEDAKIASEELGIALTKRGKLDNEEIPMCGVPVHSSQTYLARLIKKGFKIAVAEQLESTEKNNKSKQPKIFQRDVVRIITPGTILDDTLLEAKSYNHLLSISFNKGQISIGWLDMTAGSVKIQRIKGKNFVQDLVEAISKIEPTEIIISDKILDSSLWKNKFKQFEKIITEVPELYFDIENSKRKIKDFLKLLKKVFLAI